MFDGLIPLSVHIYGCARVDPDHGTTAPSCETGQASAQKSAPFPSAAHAALIASGDPVRRYNPHQVHTEFPDRWQAYIRANYRNLNHVCQVFGVSERAARKWWNGESGANGGYVGIAMQEHPVAAHRMLFAAE